MGGVVFNLLDAGEIQRLAENQAKIKILTTKLKRRKALAYWGYGEMRPVGSRQPPGGRPGDGYAPYPGSTVLTPEDIETLFGYALVRLLSQRFFWERNRIIMLQDIECVLARLEPHAPSVVRGMKDLGLQASVLGCYGITAYHCWNYIAPQHLDKDAAWTISYQLYKKGCLPDEFNFCFSQWGKLLETMENCVW